MVLIGPILLIQIKNSLESLCVEKRIQKNFASMAFSAETVQKFENSHYSIGKFSNLLALSASSGPCTLHERSVRRFY